MPDKPDGAAATAAPLPTMMPGAPLQPVDKLDAARYLQPAREEARRAVLIRDVRLSGKADPSTGINSGRQQLTAAQTIRHLATQHALTFNRDEDLTLEELLADAAVIEQYIRDGARPDPEDDADGTHPDPDEDPDTE